MTNDSESKKIQRWHHVFRELVRIPFFLELICRHFFIMGSESRPCILRTSRRVRVQRILSTPAVSEFIRLPPHATCHICSDL